MAKKRWQRIEPPIETTLEIEEFAFMGEGIAHHDGELVFVPYTIPGEKARVTIRRRKGPYLEADLLEVVDPSPHRVTPKCRYYIECTGCQWQHVAYPHQLETKGKLVADQLKRIGGFDNPPLAPTLACEPPWGYRNHARFTIGRAGQVGYVNKNTRRFVRVDECLIMDPGINQLLGKLQDKCGETTQLSVRYGVHTGKWLIQPTLQSAAIDVAVGQKYYEEQLGGRTFRVSSPSFFQVNIRQAEKLAQLVRVQLDLQGTETVVDAYAGVGTFAVLLAPYARHVIAIEESASAIADAVFNVEGLENVQLLEARTEEALVTMRPAPDAVVLDPPRTGCHPAALEALAALRPERIAYVSCDPATLGRDLKVLCASGFRLTQVQPIDMFPHTHHIEVVASLRAS